MPEYSSYDFAAVLEDTECIKRFLSEALEPNDKSYFSAALAIVARAKGLAELAEKTNLRPEQISIALAGSDNLESATTLAVLEAIGLNGPPTPRPINAS